MGLLLAHSSMKLLTGIKQDTFVHDFVCFFFWMLHNFCNQKEKECCPVSLYNQINYNWNTEQVSLNSLTPRSNL